VQRQLHAAGHTDATGYYLLDEGGQGTEWEWVTEPTDTQPTEHPVSSGYVAAEAHRRDIETIGQALIREANDRGWCGDYDRIIESINSSLAVPLPARSQKYRVYYEASMEVEVPSGTTDVEGYLRRATPTGSYSTHERI
jgi:hypothetical protein